MLGGKRAAPNPGKKADPFARYSGKGGTADKPTPKKPAAKAKPPAKKQPYEQSEYNKLSSQVASDLKKEKTEGPAAFAKTSKQVDKDLAGEQALEAAGMGHPDAKALIAAGIPEDRVKALTAQHAPTHPANQGIGETANPTTPQQSAADILIAAGLPDTASNEALLQAQMKEEEMPGSENNPLATTLPQQGSYSVNSAGVQAFPTAQEGDVADALTLKQSMPGLYNALAMGNATPQQYAAALENSNYEGLGGASNPANVAYGQAFLSDAGQPETSFPGGGSSGYSGGSYATGGSVGSQAIADASSQNLFGNLSSVIPQLGSQGQNQSLQQALSGLSTSPEAMTEQANTTQSPGSPDQASSTSQKTNVNPAANYQTILAALLPGVTPGTAGKANG